MKAGRRITRPAAASAEKPFAGFIAKFEPKMQTPIRALRRALRMRLPTANELVWDNDKFFVIGFSATERLPTASSRWQLNGAGLSFYRGSTLPDPRKIL